LPEVPAVRRMAAGAVSAEAAFMNIFGGVTPVAIARRAFKSLRGVALRAGDDDVQAEERKIRQIMIEAHVGVPLRRRVALLARPP
jgi:hypothetical protein